MSGPLAFTFRGGLMGPGHVAKLEQSLDRRMLLLPTDPGSGDIPTGTVRVVKNTTTGRISIWANDGGTMIDLLTFGTV